MKICSAPFRVSFLGGGTDFKSWYERHGCTVISCSIDRYCYVSIRKLLPFFKHNFRVSWSKIEEVNHIEQITHPSISACLKYTEVDDGLEIHTDGDLPARSGLGSSSTFTVAMLKACHNLNEQSVDSLRLAKDAIYIEQELLKEAVGVQDQIQASYGGFNIIKINKVGDFTVFNISKHNKLVREIEHKMLLVYSGIQRISSRVHTEINLRQTISGAKKDDYLREISDISNNAADKLFNDDLTFRDFCDLMGKSWEAKNSLLEGSSNTKELRNILEKGKSAGALCGKVMGGGGGGFLVFFVESDKKEEFMNNMQPYITIDPSISNHGAKSLV